MVHFLLMCRNQTISQCFLFNQIFLKYMKSMTRICIIHVKYITQTDHVTPQSPLDYNYEAHYTWRKK